MRRGDVELLFGVLGGGKISGESGSLIRQQLSEIVAELNGRKSKERQVALHLNIAETRKNFQDGIEEVEKGNKNKPIILRISSINASAAIKKVKDELELALGKLDMQTSSGITIPVSMKGSESSVKEVSEAAKQAAAAVSEMEAKLKEAISSVKSLGSEYKKTQKELQNISISDNPEDAQSIEAAKKSIEELREAYVRLDVTVNEAKRAKKDNLSDEQIRKIHAEQEALRRLIQTKREQHELSKKKPVLTVEEERAKALNQVIALYKQIDTYLNSNTRAHKTSEFIKLDGIRTQLKSVIDGVDDISSKKVTDLKQKFIDLSAGIRTAGMEGKTFGNVLETVTKRYSGYFLVARGFAAVVRQFRQMVTNVIEVDTAMTELRKVTDETSATYMEFLDNATVRAKTLGATLTDTIMSSANFARMGFGIVDSEMLGDAALLLKNVGVGINDIDEASAYIISSMKAFGIEADSVMRIVDSLNEAGRLIARAA